MEYMTTAIYEITEKNIQLGYKLGDMALIEKETDYILSKLTIVMQKVFRDKLKGIILDEKNTFFDPKLLLSEEHKSDLLNWLDKLKNIEYPATDMEFGKLKIDFERWYYKIGGESITFIYHDSYLLTPKETAEKMQISKVTLNKYISQGLDCIDTTAHNKIPQYVVELWKHPLYAVRMQMMYQERLLREQTPEERLRVINNEITVFQIKYGVELCSEAFKEFDGDSMDDPTDYYTWKDLEEEKQEIFKFRGGK